MVKKRQDDFQKTKLKVGRKLPKGTNVTNTSFKTKKINIISSLQSKGKLPPQERIKDILKNVGHSSANSRQLALSNLSLFAVEHKDLIHLHLADILSKVSNTVTDVEHSVRMESIRALKIILKLSSEMQVASFMHFLSVVLSSAMTHMTSKIREDSLELLNAMLATHPDLTCQSVSILKHLLGMISQIYFDRSNRNTRKRSLSVACSDSVDARHWRTKVLSSMNTFLEAVLRNLYKSDMNPFDKQEVYWDTCSPLYLPIYATSGLKPANIEDSKHWGFQSEVESNYGIDLVREFICQVVPLLSDIFTEEVAGYSSADDDLMSVETVKTLNVILQVLCRLGEWVIFFSDADEDIEKDFLKLYCENLNNKIMKRFPFATRDPALGKPKDEVLKPCVQLNLAACYLYSAFLLDIASTADSFKENVCSYLKTISKKSSCEIRYDSIPVMMKIIENFVKTNNPYKEFINSVMAPLCSILKTKEDCENTKKLIDFLIDLCLLPKYNNLIECSFIKTWLQWLVEDIWEMPKKNVTKKLLKSLKKIASQKFPSFLKQLDSTPDDDIIAALKFENQDYQDIILNLIVTKPEVSSYLLQNINLLISKKILPVNLAFRFVRLLKLRLKSPEVSLREYVHFAEFFVNVAIDSPNVHNNEWLGYDLPEFKELWEPCNDVAAFNIVPSLYWKKHFPLFEEAKSGMELIPTKVLTRCTVLLIKSVMENARYVPIHCAIGILRLKKSTADRYFMCLMQDLSYSCLLFLSVFTMLQNDDEWFDANVVELMGSLDMNRKIVRDTIMQFEYDSKAVRKDIVIFHLLRICKFLISRKLMLPSDREKMLTILDGFQTICDTSLKEQPLWVQIVEFFQY